MIVTFGSGLHAILRQNQHFKGGLQALQLESGEKLQIQQELSSQLVLQYRSLATEVLLLVPFFLQKGSLHRQLRGLGLIPRRTWIFVQHFAGSAMPMQPRCGRYQEGLHLVDIRQEPSAFDTKSHLA